jgi:hypothetical protein
LKEVAMTAVPFDVADPVAALVARDAGARSVLEDVLPGAALDYVREHHPEAAVAFAADLVFALDGPVMNPDGFHGRRD